MSDVTASCSTRLYLRRLLEAECVQRRGKAVCAALDKAQNGGDIFRLSLTIAHAGGFSLKDAANVIARSAVADCPWEEPKIRQAGNSAGSAATPPA